MGQVSRKQEGSKSSARQEEDPELCGESQSFRQNEGALGGQEGAEKVAPHGRIDCRGIVAGCSEVSQAESLLLHHPE